MSKKIKFVVVNLEEGEEKDSDGITFGAIVQDNAKYEKVMFVYHGFKITEDSEEEGKLGVMAGMSMVKHDEGSSVVNFDDMTEEDKDFTQKLLETIVNDFLSAEMDRQTDK